MTLMKFRSQKEPTYANVFHGSQFCYILQLPVAWGLWEKTVVEISVPTDMLPQPRQNDQTLKAYFFGIELTRF